ncbi:Glutaredoxin [Mycena kentingensis (nom. inval.)]|nr:Glutaredoxin [Mycena kentingensis (nom. inval.)]
MGDTKIDEGTAERLTRPLGAGHGSPWGYPLSDYASHSLQSPPTTPAPRIMPLPTNPPPPFLRPLNLIPINSPNHIQTLLCADLTRLSLLYFWAPWAEPCTQMNAVVTELARGHPTLLVLSIEAEEQVDITESFAVDAVPAFLVLRGHTLLARISGADAPALTKSITTHIGAPSPLSPLPAELDARMRSLMRQSWIVLFMKGTPDAPRCGFSRKIVALLHARGVPFDYFDILKDEAVRQGAQLSLSLFLEVGFAELTKRDAGLKRLNDWPTFPQLIINGSFVGGLDVVQDMVDNGEFDAAIKGRKVV